MKLQKKLTEEEVRWGWGLRSLAVIFAALFCIGSMLCISLLDARHPGILSYAVVLMCPVTIMLVLGLMIRKVLEENEERK